MSGPRVYLEAYGCSASLADSEMLLGLLKSAAFDRAVTPSDADLSLIVTCTVKTATANRMVHRITELARSGRPLIVAGCMPMTERSIIERINPSASLLGPGALHDVVEVAHAALDGRRLVRIEDSRRPKVGLPRVRANPVIGVVEIGSGCLSSCAFCQVKIAKGGLISYRIGAIVQEVQQAVREGCKEIWLTSTDNAPYGRDIGTSLPELLNNVCAVEGDFRVRVGMMNPAHVRRMLSDLVNAYQNPKVFKFLHLPVQSGSDRILELMGRGHSVDEFLEIVESFRAAIPHLTLATDIIVGFPTETDEDFEMTAQLLRAVEPDIVNLSKFAARPRTRAARMPQLPARLIADRSGELHQLIKDISLRRNRRWIGWCGDVLVDEQVDGAMVARNVAYKPVLLKPVLQLGTALSVRIEDATAACLRGEPA